MCKHEQTQLVGTADGILCRACGRRFGSFAEVERDRAPQEQPKAEKPVKSGRKKKEATK